MSMTDGHIYFDSDLFYRGRRPAINPFVSVTRVGRQTQTPLGRDVGRVLLELLNSYEKTQSFLKFGAELGENSRQVLAIGEKILALFDQPQLSVIEANIQPILVGLMMAGLWDGLNGVKMSLNYQNNQQFRESADEIVAKHQSLNSLVEELRRNPGAWQRFLT